MYMDIGSLNYRRKKKRYNFFFNLSQGSEMEIQSLCFNLNTQRNKNSILPQTIFRITAK